MLDSRCGTYVLSTDFVSDNDIPCFPCKPIPVELAVRNAGRFTLDTQTKKLPMYVGTIAESKASYVLPLPGCDAIFSMPFLNGRKLITHLERNTVSIDDLELPLVQDRHEPVQISLITRSRLKAEIRKNEFTELYLATIKTTDDGPDLAKNPEWIKDEFYDIFLDGLPPGMAPERKIKHEIPLYPDSPPQFRGIFHLSQMELHELRKQLDQLLYDGKISPSTSPYGAPVLFVKKKLNPHQRNYPVHDKEMCAIMHALDRWRTFLLGRHFKVYADHRSLVYLKTQPNLNQRQLRWMERAADYDCEILYKPGKENVVTDALSRIHLSALSSLPNSSVRSSIIKGYRKEPFASLIKEVEGKRGTYTRYTFEDGLLYY